MMTPEEQKAAEEEMIRFQEENPDYWGDQDENGVDVARLRENLKLTPAERLHRLEAGRRSLRWLQSGRVRNAVL